MGSARLHLTKRFTFEAAHTLPWHKGKCARPHGHSYVLEVTVAGPVRPDDGEADAGMVVDFAVISDAVKPLIFDWLDHYSLNRLMENPTAERLVLWLADALTPALPELETLRLYETTSGWVEWRKPDGDA